MKVILINGSPNKMGSTHRCLVEVEKELNNAGVETEIIQVGHLKINGCLDCKYCSEHKRCAIDDIVNEVAEKLKMADGIVIGSPVYYSSPNGALISFLDRLFHSRCVDWKFKVGASVCVARRGGAMSTFDVLNKYLTKDQMVIVTSNYWNIAYGWDAEDVEKDAEGLQTMRLIGKNMAFMIKAIKDAKEKYGLPSQETKAWTSFFGEK